MWREIEAVLPIYILILIT